MISRPYDAQRTRRFHSLSLSLNSINWLDESSPQQKRQLFAFASTSLELMTLVMSNSLALEALCAHP